MTFTVGQWVVLRGRAIGRVRAIRDGVMVIAEADEEREGTIEVALADASAHLRPMVTAAEAAELVASLAAPHEVGARSVAERSIAYRRALKADLRDQVRTLAAIYRHPKPDYPERQ